VGGLHDRMLHQPATVVGLSRSKSQASARSTPSRLAQVLTSDAYDILRSG